MSKYTFKNIFTFIYLHILCTPGFCIPVFIEFPPNGRHSSRTEDTGTTHTKHMYSPCAFLIDSRRNVIITVSFNFYKKPGIVSPSCI